MLKLTVAKWANDYMISWAYTKEMVANASGRAESFTPTQYTILADHSPWGFAPMNTSLKSFFGHLGIDAT